MRVRERKLTCMAVIGYKKSSCNTRFVFQLHEYTYVHIFFLTAGYCVGQWYFRISACVSVVRYVKYASVTGRKGNYAFYRARLFLTPRVIGAR